jgi:formylmethanofuran dehydrogenase subunit A
VHIHTNNLGLPGNWSTTLETMKLLEGHRGHLTHIQFHSYGGGDQAEESFCSNVAPLADYANAHPNITVDVGQVVFGQTTSMTADGPVGYFLSRLYKTKWFSADTEQEEGCGVVPIEYKNTSLIHAWQWAIGLEWYLLVEDPWRIVMTTDHPNGGSFLAYPQIIRLLMDRTYRQDILKTVPGAVRDRSLLKDLDREYSLSEIAIITRAGPARILGLKNKGHLGPGADADVTIYTPDANRETMFELPRHVIKAGRIIVEHGEIREDVQGKTLLVSPEYDRDVESDIRSWFEGSYSIQWRNYPVEDTAIPNREVTPCQS